MRSIPAIEEILIKKLGIQNNTIDTFSIGDSIKIVSSVINNVGFKGEEGVIIDIVRSKNYPIEISVGDPVSFTFFVNPTDIIKTENYARFVSKVKEIQK